MLYAVFVCDVECVMIWLVQKHMLHYADSMYGLPLYYVREACETTISTHNSNNIGKDQVILTKK